MGDKRVSIRTLPDGTKVHHHPDGRQVLIREGSALRDRLEAQLEENQRRHAALHEAHQERVEFKRAAGQDKGLPPEKSPC